MVKTRIEIIAKTDIKKIRKIGKYRNNESTQA